MRLNLNHDQGERLAQILADASCPDNCDSQAGCRDILAPCLRCQIIEQTQLPDACCLHAAAGNQCADDCIEKKARDIWTAWDDLKDARRSATMLFSPSDAALWKALGTAIRQAGSLLVGSEAGGEEGIPLNMGCR